MVSETVAFVMCGRSPGLQIGIQKCQWRALPHSTGSGRAFAQVRSVRPVGAMRRIRPLMNRSKELFRENFSGKIMQFAQTNYSNKQDN